MHMPRNRPSGEKIWRPAGEAEATGNIAAFIEWASATGSVPAQFRDPASLRQWLKQDPAASRQAVAAFAGLRPEAGFAGNLLRYRGNRIALRVWSASGAYRSWTRDALRGGGLPAGVAAVLSGGTWDDLTRLAASHLLVAGTRPDDTVQWLGAADAPWPLGAWLAGAGVVLGGPVQAAAKVFAAEP